MEDKGLVRRRTRSVSDFTRYLKDSIRSYENSSIDRQNLRSELLGEITSHFKRGSSLDKCNDGLLKAHDKAIKALGIIIRTKNAKNDLPHITSINSELYKFIAPLHTSPPTQFQSISSSVNVRFNLLETFVNYLTQLYDPDEHSQRITDGYNFGGADDYTIPDITDHTAALICGSFFSPNVPSDCQYKYKRRVVCLLLAVICGSRQNSEVIICPPIMDLICAALRFNNFSFLTSSTDSSVLVRTALFSCLKVIVWRLHQSNDPTVTRKLEVDNVIDYFITIIEETNLKPDASMRFLPDVFDVLQSMVKLQTNSEALKASFISMQISRRIIDICSKCPASDVRSSNQILEGALMFLYQLFKNSPDSKSDFTRNVRYERFLDVVKQFGEPTQQLLYRFLELVVESVITDPRPDENSELVLKTKDICNVELLSMLVEWIPFIEDGNTQKWLSKMLRDLSTQRERNKIVCCSAGVSETALKVITDHLLHERSPAAASYLMQLVEKLGCLSVSAADLKQMFLLIQKDNGPQKVDGRDSICITMRILRALAGICVAQRKVRALHYFSLPDQSSCIKVELRSDSHIKDTFTFHCWICVDSESWSDHKITGIRRILYRFQSASGYFESFINADGHLCIAAYKPDHQDHVYTAFIATDQRTDRKTVVADGLWHMIDISLSQRKWKVYIDAQPQHTCTLKNTIRINNHDACYKIGGPIISEDPEFLSTARPHTSNPRKSIKGIIGGISRGISGRRKKGQDNPDIIQNYDNEAALDNATGLRGCLGTIIVFTEQLNFKKVRLLYDLGPNRLLLFEDNHGLMDLKRKRFFHYNAKMARDNICYDLTDQRNGLLNGHACSSHNLKDIVECNGGIQLTFLPLLQYIKNKSQPNLPEELNSDNLIIEHTRNNNLAALFHLIQELLHENKESPQHMIDSIQTISDLLHTTPQNQILNSPSKANEKQLRYRQWRRQGDGLIGKVLASWQDTMPLFQSSRGIWPEPSIAVQHWIRSGHENYSRMRLKFIPNVNFDDHELAARRRDQTSQFEQEKTAPDIMISMSNEEDEDSSSTESDSTAGASSHDELSSDQDEKFDGATFECSIIIMQDPVVGQMRISNKYVYYNTDTDADDISDWMIPLDTIREIHERSRTLQKTAIELFLTDQTNYFFNFPDRRTRQQVEKKLKSVTKKLKVKIYKQSKSNILKDSELTERWRRREISNFSYLMELNSISGRTYNDWTQYPIFPWVLVDYTSEKLDLDDPKVYRDLTKPVGILAPGNEEKTRNKYKEMELDRRDTDPIPYHYGKPYSAPLFVMHYLIRLEPFTTQHIQLQSGRFDGADRQFHSVEASFRSIMSGMDDFRELIPEFFCMPEFLLNRDEFDLGVRQHDNVKVDNVILPPWADGCPYKFIRLHRKALESELVSNNLHHWIDLIFGYKQRGRAAIDAVNVFIPISYAGNYVREKSDDPRKELIERQINEFGQVPRQLLTTGHPRRMTRDGVIALLIKENKPISILPHTQNCITAFKAKIYSQPFAGKIIVASVPQGQIRNQIAHNSEKMVTISDTGCVGQHDWSAGDHKLHKNRNVDDKNHKGYIPGPFMPDTPLASNRLAVSYDGRQIIVGGYWDNSFRVFSLENWMITQIVTGHYGIVTCLSLDSAGEYLITGSADTTCKIWQIRCDIPDCDINPTALQCLYGHDDEVSAVSISVEYDMAVTGSKDGTINIHTVKKGLFVRTIDLNLEKLYHIDRILISYMGHILVCAQPNQQNQQKAQSSRLYLYTVNGDQFTKRSYTDHHIISCLTLGDDYLFIGTNSGNLYIYELTRLDEKPVDEHDLGNSIRSISFTRKFTHLFIGVSNSEHDLYIRCRKVVEPHFRKP